MSLEEYEFERIRYRGYTIRIIQDSYPVNPREDYDHLGTFYLWNRHVGSPDKTDHKSLEDWVASMSGLDPDYVDCADRLANGSWRVCWGGSHFKWKGRWRSLDELFAIQLKEIEKEYVVLGVDFYDHRCDCRYVAGELTDKSDGVIFVEKKKLLEETGYTADELFSKDAHRRPIPGNHVKINGDPDWATFRGVPDWVKFPRNSRLRLIETKRNYGMEKREQLVVYKHEIVEVMSNMAETMLVDEVREFDNWANNYVAGYVIEPEIEGEIDSCWGYYPDENGNWDYPISEAKSLIDSHIESERKRHYGQVKARIRNRVPLGYRKPLDKGGYL